ncbi:MAG: alpha/beta hydrolase [Bacteroidota bacterium]
MRTITLLACLFCVVTFKSQPAKILYLFPGQGSDARIFSKIDFDSSYRIVHIQYSVPAKKTSLKQYSQILMEQIDTTTNYSFIGMSLGGMICSELAEIMHPQKTIIISSAKCRSELPSRYRFQKNIPLYKLIPKRMIKLGARILQPIVEPDRKKYKAVFKSMLKQKDARFLKRTVAMIVQWEKINCSARIYHIHGTKDHTLPIRKTKPGFIVQKGSHMMTLTRAGEIGKLINEFLRK